MDGLTCSFCGHSEEDRVIICGPAVYICDECLSLCVFAMREIILGQRKGIAELRNAVHYLEVVRTD